MRILIILSLALLTLAATASAQPAPPAMPVASVQAETLADPSRPVVVELFTAKSCVFCPPADKKFAELAQRQGVIAIACHVDYFRSTDPLAQKFCISRQAWYMDRLRAGPAYTPQYVINGSRDTAGRNADRLEQLIKNGMQQDVQTIRIAPAKANAYEIHLPESFAKTPLKGWMLVVAAFRRPMQTAINAKDSTPIVRAASALQILPLDTYKGAGFQLTVPLTDEQEGFAVLLQRQDTGMIAGAGQFLKTPAQETP